MNINTQSPLLPSNTSYETLHTARVSTASEEAATTELRSDAAITSVEESADARGMDPEHPGEAGAAGGPQAGVEGSSEQSSGNPIIEQIKEMIEQIKEAIVKTEAQLASAKARMKGPDDEAGRAGVNAIQGQLSTLNAQLSGLYGQLADAIKKASESDDGAGAVSGQMLNTSA